MSGIAAPFWISCFERDRQMIRSCWEIDVGSKLYLINEKEAVIEQIEHLKPSCLIRIPAGLIGPGIPNNTLYLTPTQEVIIDGYRLKAGEIEGVELVRDVDRRVYSLKLSRPGIVLVNDLRLIIPQTD